MVQLYARRAVGFGAESEQAPTRPPWWEDEPPAPGIMSAGVGRPLSLGTQGEDSALTSGAPVARDKSGLPECFPELAKRLDVLR